MVSSRIRRESQPVQVMIHVGMCSIWLLLRSLVQLNLFTACIKLAEICFML